ncbi:transcriptional repressor [Spirochaetia bacterium 38H-sp]|uniref:Transcriptional repressor n=1 Tax=Rarispira pelagica TaxID=3141764 RepID=A0ABU9U8J2_9SPIR
MTRIRQSVLDIVKKAQTPLSAAGVLARMSETCHQATIYRALKYLEAKGHLQSFVLPCEEHGTEKYYMGSAAGSHKHWFHCTSCHSFLPLSDCTLSDTIYKLEKEKNISIRGHVLYFTGLCEDCRDNK